jgi:hypothetical protein
MAGGGEPEETCPDNDDESVVVDQLRYKDIQKWVQDSSIA